MEQLKCSCRIFILLVFAVCFSTEGLSANIPKDVCSFDIRGVKLGVSESEFHSLAKVNFTQKRKDSSFLVHRPSKPPIGAIIAGDEFKAIISSPDYGGKLYFLKYTTNYHNVDANLLFSKTDAKLKEKYGFSSVGAMGPNTNVQCWGQNCESIIDKIFKLGEVDSSLIEQVQGCHLVFIFKAADSANISLYLFDGALEQKAVKEGNNDKKTNTNKIEIKF